MNSATTMNTPPLLSVEHLAVDFGDSRVVDDVSFSIRPGEKFALVGESGSGKSISALSVLRLVDAATTRGAIRFDGEELLAKNEREMRAVRGKRIGMISSGPISTFSGRTTNLTACPGARFSGPRVGTGLPSIRTVMSCPPPLPTVPSMTFEWPMKVVTKRVFGLS